MNKLSIITELKTSASGKFNIREGDPEFTELTFKHTKPDVKEILEIAKTSLPREENPQAAAYRLTARTAAINPEHLQNALKVRGGGENALERLAIELEQYIRAIKSQKF